MLTPEEINFFFAMVESLTGTNQSGDFRKEVLLINLELRMRRFKISNLFDYLNLLRDDDLEFKSFLSSITIHTTNWFRELPHFLILEKFLIKKQFTLDKKIRIWIPGCSTGEEVFSFAFVLESLNLNYEIYGTDIDPICIEKAKSGTFNSEVLTTIPSKYHSYFDSKSTKAENELMIFDRILKKCFFKNEDIRFKKTDFYDVISCRNLLIYFSKTDVKNIVENLILNLNLGGILILGHSESLQDYKLFEKNNFELDFLGNNCFLKKERRSLNLKLNPSRNDNFPLSFKVKKTILLVDDVMVARLPIKNILIKNNYEVIEASSAREATAAIKLKNGAIDLIVLDVQMPEESGIEWLAKFRASGGKTPVVIASSSSPDEIRSLMGALVGGAQEFFIKELIYKRLDLLLKTIDNLTEKSLFSRKELKQFKLPNYIYKKFLVSKSNQLEIIAVGASTGGPEALNLLFKNLNYATPPIFIIQHINVFFTQYLAATLAKSFGIKFSTCSDGEKLEDSTLYIPQNDVHIVLEKRGRDIFIRHQLTEAIHNIRPSINIFFDSIAKEKISSAAFILTGMGKDGANGLLEIARTGLSYTLAQDEETSVVYGMPREAVANGSVQFQGSITQLREQIDIILKNRINIRRVA